jgi:molybdate/tungstate transport system permease protein
MLKEERVREAIYLTALTATVSTLVLIVFSIPLAYAVSRARFFGKALFLSLVDLPIVIPQSAAGIALLRVFGKQQFLGETLFNVFGIRFDGTILGICLAQVFVSLPFIMKSALSAFESVPVTLEQSARTLGASPFGAFRRVAVPLASRGIFVGIVLAWARAAGEFGAVLFVAPYPKTAPIEVYDRFVTVGVVQAAPLVTTLLLFSVAMFFILQLAMRTLPKVHGAEHE